MKTIFQKELYFIITEKYLFAQLNELLSDDEFCDEAVPFCRFVCEIDGRFMQYNVDL